MMKKLISMVFIFAALIISGCTASSPNDNADVESKEPISAEQSVDNSTDGSFEQSTSVDSTEDSVIDSTEDSSSENVSTEDSSCEVENSEESSIEPSESDVPNNEASTEPSPEDSKPEDITRPAEDVSKPVECEHEYITAQKKAPTCTEDGEEETYCKYCKLVNASTGIQRLDHSWSEWVVMQEATTANEGSQQRTCFRCGHQETEIIPKIEEAEISFTEADADYIADEFLRILNEKRAELGRQPLVTAPIAHQMATERAVQISEYFSHNLPNGDNASYEMYAKYMYNSEREGIPYKSGENIGSCYVSVDSIVRWGMESELQSVARQLITSAEASYGHWYDLTNERYTACGVGVCIAIDDEYGEYFAYICIMTMDKLYGTDAA